MRHLYVWCFAVGLSMIGTFTASCQNGDDTGTVEGVVNGATGLLTVYLQAIDDNPLRYYDGYKATAKQDGSFIFTYVKPGTYQIKAQASGFMLAPTGNTTSSKVTLRANQTLRGIKIAMAPVTQVCGRITDNGVPRKSTVQAWKLDPEFGTLSGGKTLSTADDGLYRFSNLAPGTYFLQTNAAWYPHAALSDFQDAEPIVVGPDLQHGADHCKFDVAMQYITAEQFRHYTGCHPAKVHTSITQVTGVENQQFMVSIRRRNPAGGSVWAFNSNADKLFHAGDSFEESFCPGNYEVVLTDNVRMSWENEPIRHKVVFDTQEISLGEGETRELVLTPHPMAKIRGEVHFEGITRRGICPAQGGQYVAIVREGDGQFQSTQIGENNRFVIDNVAPGDYQLYLGKVLREAVFLKSLVVDGKSYTTGRQFSIPPPKTAVKDVLIGGGRQFPITEVKPTILDITLSGDVALAKGHVSPDVRGDPRWEEEWTRPRGRVSGKIAEGLSNGLAVKLRSARYNSDASFEYSVKLEKDGTFHFDEVDPGAYILSVEGKDFFPNEYGAVGGGKQGLPIVVSRGGEIEGLSLTALKLSSICGRVSDETGNPLAHVRIAVQSFQHSYMQNWGRNSTEAIVTDQDGFFRADGFAPGDYFVSYLGAAKSWFFSPDGTLHSAAPLHLFAGKDAGCIPSDPLELRLAPRGKSSYSVAGTVIGNWGKEVGNRFWVSLTDQNGDEVQVSVRSSKVDAEHHFKIDNVANGQYVLELNSGYGRERMSWSGPYPPRVHSLAKQRIDVRNANITDAKITSTELPTVTGVVHFTNLPESWKGKTFDKTTVRIMLLPQNDQAPNSAMLSSNETFRMSSIDAGDYAVSLRYDFNQLYIHSIRMNGTALEGRHLNLRQGEAAQLEIEISGDGGQVNFSLLSDPSLPMPEPPGTEECRSQPLWTLTGMQVILLPDRLVGGGSNGSAFDETDIIRARRVSDGAKTWYQAWNVPPGKYRAIAAEPLPRTLSMNLEVTHEGDLAFLRALGSLGQPLTIEANSKQDIALPDRTIDAARLASKMGLALSPDPTVLQTQ